MSEAESYPYCALASLPTRCGRAGSPVPRSLPARIGLLLLSVYLALATAPATALTELEDADLNVFTGEGLTFAWTDFRMLIDPGSYLELMGAPGSNTCTSGGATAGNYNCWRRGDTRWYGLNVSNTSQTVGQAVGAGPWNTTWTTDAGGTMTQCASAGINGLGCPRGGPIALFAAHDNPYILRAFRYAGDGTAATSIGSGIVTYQGNNATTDWPTGSGQTVLDWFAPTKQDYYRYSSWGEIEVGRGGTGAGLLKSQTIFQGNAAGSILRFFTFTQTSTSPGLAVPYNPMLGAAGCTNTGCPNVDAAGSVYNNRSLAIQYESHLRGDFRLSNAQTEAAPVIGVPVVFHPTEGLYFRNADVFIPLGQPFYQALTINFPRNTSTNAPITDGNFTLEIPILPNRTAVFTRFYSLNTTPAVDSTSPFDGSVLSAWDYGYATFRAAFLNMTAANNAGRAYMPNATPNPTNYPNPNANYFKTHGYVRWGDWFICQGIGCNLPMVANSVAQATAGTGRNAWNSSGDGVFFIGTTAYNAYAYQTTNLDMRPFGDANENALTSIVYYQNTASCTPASSTDYFACGYGGAYLGATSFGSPMISATILPAENAFYNSAANDGVGENGMGANAARNVIPVPAGTPLNLGDSRIEGLQINFLRFTSLGANF